MNAQAIAQVDQIMKKFGTQLHLHPISFTLHVFNNLLVQPNSKDFNWEQSGFKKIPLKYSMGIKIILCLPFTFPASKLASRINCLINLVLRICGILSCTNPALVWCRFPIPPVQAAGSSCIEGRGLNISLHRKTPHQNIIYFFYLNTKANARGSIPTSKSKLHIELKCGWLPIARVFLV